MPKVSKKYMLTPRHCKSCGQWMSQEFLESRWEERAIKISDSLRETLAEKAGRVAKESNDSIKVKDIIALCKQGVSYRGIERRTGVHASRVRRVWERYQKSERRVSLYKPVDKPKQQDDLFLPKGRN